MNGILLLTLAIFFSSAVAITMKVAHAKRLDLGQFLAVNYLVCTLSILSLGAWRTVSMNSIFIWSLGIFVGIMYVLCLWLFNRSIAVGGLALSTTLMRLSAVFPTLGSLMFFSEQANLYQILGIVLAFICLPLASKEPLQFDQAGKEALQGMTWGLLLFAAYGLTDFAFKIQAELESSADPKAFILTIFGTALLLTLPQLIKKNRPSPHCFLWGSVLGATNILATYFWIRTLTHIPGSVAYPTLGLVSEFPFFIPVVHQVTPECRVG
jgi:drug/metabolite transporter (DMT)-like permease